MAAPGDGVSAVLAVAASHELPPSDLLPAGRTCVTGWPCPSGRTSSMIRRPVLEEPVRLMEPLASRLAPDVLSRLRDAHAEPAERLRDLAGRAAVRRTGAIRRAVPEVHVLL